MVVVTLFAVLPGWIIFATDWSRGMWSLTTIPGGQTSHAITLSLLCIVSCYLYRRMKYLYPVVRVMTTMTIVVLQVHFYDFLWSVNSGMFRITTASMKLNTISLAVVFLTWCLLLRLNQIHGIFYKQGDGVPFVVFLLMTFGLLLAGFYGMAETDFWNKMDLVDAGQCCIDPNQNMYWVVSKIASMILFLPLISEREGLTAPLELHPRIITW